MSWRVAGIAWRSNVLIVRKAGARRVGRRVQHGREQRTGRGLHETASSCASPHCCGGCGAACRRRRAASTAARSSPRDTRARSTARTPSCVAHHPISRSPRTARTRVQTYNLGTRTCVRLRFPVKSLRRLLIRYYFLRVKIFLLISFMSIICAPQRPRLEPRPEIQKVELTKKILVVNYLSLQKLNRRTKCSK